MNDSENKGMSFQECLQKLDIEDYSERIFNSSSTGELGHLGEYVMLANLYNGKDFRPWFVATVKMAEDEWDRPESVFQHILEIFHDSIIRI